MSRNLRPEFHVFLLQLTCRVLPVNDLMVRVHNLDKSSDEPVWSASSVNGSILLSRLNPGSKYLVTLTDNSGNIVHLQLETLSLPTELMAETRHRQEVKTTDMTAMIVMVTCLLVIVMMVVLLSAFLLLKRISNSSEGMISESLYQRQGLSQPLTGCNNRDQPLDMRDVCKVSI